MALHTGVGLAIAGASLFVLLGCIPLWQGRVKMNRIYGMRVPRAFESDPLWYEINRYGGKLFVIWSAAILGIGLLSILIPYPDDGPLPLIVALTPPFLYVVAALQIYLYSRKL